MELKTVMPADKRSDSMAITVEPFPFVPATVTTCSAGFSKSNLPTISLIRSKPISIALLCCREMCSNHSCNFIVESELVVYETFVESIATRNSEAFSFSLAEISLGLPPLATRSTKALPTTIPSA